MTLLLTVLLACNGGYDKDDLDRDGYTPAQGDCNEEDAAVNPGNFGGPLVDLKGEVVGINARAIPVFGENLGFAIPVRIARWVVPQLKDHGEVSRSTLGIIWQPTQDL